MANLQIRGKLTFPEKPLPDVLNADELRSFEIKINLYDMIKQDFMKNIQNEGAYFLYRTNIIEEMEPTTCQAFFENYFRERIIDLLDRDALPVLQLTLQQTVNLLDYRYILDVGLNIEEEYEKYKLRAQFK